MHQLVLDLTRRCQTMFRARGMPTEGDIQEVLIACLESFTTVLETKVMITPMATEEAQRNLRFIAMRPVLEAIVDRPELAQVFRGTVQDVEKGIFKTMEQQTIRVMLLQIGERKPAVVPPAP